MLLLWFCCDYVILQISWCYYFIIIILYFHYTDNSYDRDDIPLTQFVLKRKTEFYEEDEILEDEQEEDKESIYETDDEGMCILVWFVLYSYYWIASVTYNNSCLSVIKSELVWLQLGYS